LAHGLASIRPYRHRYVSTGEPDQNAQLQALQAEFGELAFFCINDTTDDAQAHDPRLQNVLTVLQSILPLPSAFEDSTTLGQGEHLGFEPHDFLAHDNPVDAQQPTNASGLQKRA
jgi:hypothetical protein